VWPIGDDLAPAVKLRAHIITLLIARFHQPPMATKPSEAERKIMQKFRAFARAYEALPEGARPTLNWRALRSGLKSALAEARMKTSATTKGDVADMIAIAHHELTGDSPHASGIHATPFSRLVEDIFELGAIDGGHAVAGHAAKRFTA
jgi:hypothetical protein